MSLTLVTGPAIEPVTLSEMKLQCGFGPMEDTDQLREQIVAEQLRPAVVAARQQCEALCARAFLTQTWRLTLNRFPHWDREFREPHQNDIALPLPTFQSITAFTYIDTGGNVIDNTAQGAWGYQVVSGGDTRPAYVRPPALLPWPLTQWDTPDAVVITYTCGFGNTLASLPYAVRVAVKICAQWIYEGSKGNMPGAVMALLAPYILDVA